jgi:hypothetical protein
LLGVRARASPPAVPQPAFRGGHSGAGLFASIGLHGRYQRSSGRRRWPSARWLRGRPASCPSTERTAIGRRPLGLRMLLSAPLGTVLRRVVPGGAPRAEDRAKRSLLRGGSGPGPGKRSAFWRKLSARTRGQPLTRLGRCGGTPGEGSEVGVCHVRALVIPRWGESKQEFAGSRGERLTENPQRREVAAVTVRLRSAVAVGDVSWRRRRAAPPAVPKGEAGGLPASA